MEKPLCKICKERHYGLCPSIQGQDEASASKAIPRNAKPMAGRIPTSKTHDPVPKQPSVAATPTKAKFDRVAYQRDLMRKRRAEIKAGIRIPKPSTTS